MKQLNSLFLCASIALASLLPVAAPVSVIMLADGCAAGHGRWDPNTQTYSNDVEGDPVVVNAQKARATALNAFATYFKIEKENRWPRDRAGGYRCAERDYPGLPEGADAAEQVVGRQRAYAGDERAQPGAGLNGQGAGSREAVRANS